MTMDILIVEDNRHMRRMLVEMVELAFPDACVGEATDGATAYFQIDAWRPRVIVMDIDLPDANGLSVARRVKELLPDLAILIVTHHDSNTYQAHASAIGVRGYIHKDNAHAQLLPLLSSILGSANEAKSQPC